MRNSKRERALEYAKGISRPRQQFAKYNSQVEQANDEDEDEELYQYHNNTDVETLEHNHQQYLSEIDKIKAMFN